MPLCLTILYALSTSNWDFSGLLMQIYMTVLYVCYVCLHSFGTDIKVCLKISRSGLIKLRLLSTTDQMTKEVSKYRSS